MLNWIVNSINNSSTKKKKKKKKNLPLYFCLWGYDNYENAYFQSSWEDVALEVSCVLCKEYRCNLQDTFRLISNAIMMTS